MLTREQEKDMAESVTVTMDDMGMIVRANSGEWTVSGQDVDRVWADALHYHMMYSNTDHEFMCRRAVIGHSQERES